MGVVPAALDEIEDGKAGFGKLRDELLNG